MNEMIPLEHEEACTLADWMAWNGLKYSHIPNETYTKSYKQKMKNKLEGVMPGVPDYLIIIPAEKSKTNKAELIFIELKRKKHSRTSEEQKEWIEAINETCVDAHICKGADAAIEVIESYMK
jgi:hypothetical protein